MAPPPSTLLLVLGTLAVLGGVGALLWPVGGPGEADCATLDGADRDRCLHDRVRALPAAEAERVVATAADFADPLVRDASLLTWINAHRPELTDDAALAVCRQLSTTEARACERKVMSPHLWR